MFFKDRKIQEEKAMERKGRTGGELGYLLICILNRALRQISRKRTE